MIFWGVAILVTFGVAQVELQDSDLTESSGVSWSDQTQLAWTHNDSGDEPRIFAFDAAGNKKAEVRISSAKAIDWEDICLFRKNDETYIAIGDVGDNQAQRPEVQIYIVLERELLAAERESRRAKLECTITVQYEGGAVNCESLAYDPERESFLLISKQQFLSQVYECSVSSFSRDREIKALKTQRLLVPLSTGADISNDGQHLVVSTYGPAMLFERKNARWQACKEPALEVPPRRQGESVCFAFEKTKLLFTSEFAPSPLLSVELPDAIIGNQR